MWSAAEKTKVKLNVLFPSSETYFMVSGYGHISKGLSWFKTRSLRLEIILPSCQNISLLLLWGHYGLNPKVQPFYSKALICLLPVQIRLHLFWHDWELLSQAPGNLHPQVKALPHPHESCLGRARSEGGRGLPGAPTRFSSDAPLLGTERFRLSTYTLDHEDRLSE